MATTSRHRAAVQREPGRYQRDQRIARAGTIVFVSALTFLALWALQRSYAEQREASDDGAASVGVPAAPITEHEWLTGTEPSIDALVTARNDIAAAAAHHDLVGTGAACRKATGAVANLNQQLPSPEPMLNQSLLQAISGYSIGLPYCISASQTRDGAGLQHAATYISQADAAMRDALDLLDNIPGGHSGNLPVLIV